MSALKEYLDKTTLQAEYKKDCLTVVRSAITGTEPVELKVISKDIVMSQKNIGWKLFLRGLWSNQWRIIWKQQGNNNSRSPSFSIIMLMIWEKQLILWKEICNESQRSSGNENDSQRELEAHIRHLNARENELQAED